MTATVVARPARREIPEATLVSSRRLHSRRAHNLMAESNDIDAFLAAYPPEAREIIDAARRLVRTIVPDADETLDVPGRIIAYSYGPGYNGMLFSVIPSRGGAKIGVVRGAELPDPTGLLEGRGTLHRHVALRRMEDLDREGLRELLTSAVAAWRERERVGHSGNRSANHTEAGRP